MYGILLANGLLKWRPDICYFRCSGIRFFDIIPEHDECAFVQTHPVAHAALEMDSGNYTSNIDKGPCEVLYNIDAPSINHRPEIELDALLSSSVFNMFGGYDGHYVQVCPCLSS